MTVKRTSATRQREPPHLQRKYVEPQTRPAPPTKQNAPQKQKI